MAAGVLLMAQVRVEVVADARLEPVEIDIDEECIAAGLDPRKRGREQVGQRRPVEPLITHSRSHERQAEWQDGLDRVVERIRRRFRGRRELRGLGLSPQVPESDLPSRRVVSPGAPAS